MYNNSNFWEEKAGDNYIKGGWGYVRYYSSQIVCGNFAVSTVEEYVKVCEISPAEVQIGNYSLDLDYSYLIKICYPNFIVSPTGLIAIIDPKQIHLFDKA